MDHLYDYLDKLLALILSRRFQVTVGAIVLLLLRDRLGFDPETVKLIQQAAIAWVIADSLQPTVHSDGSGPTCNSVTDSTAFTPRR